METVRIERFTSRVHAELACSMLVSHGINARVSGDDVGGVHPDIPYGIGGTAVVVPTEQLEEATALLDDRFDGQLGDVDDEEATPDPDGITAGRRGLPGAADADDRTGGADWVATGRAAERRRGIKAFALVTAIVILLVLSFVTGIVPGWWS